MDTPLIKQVRQYAEETFKNPAFNRYTYHNLEHTQDVINAINTIGMQSKLTDDEMETAIVAGWFHDIGYLSGGSNHEAKSAYLAEEMLGSWEVEPKKITAVSDAISATKMPQNPVSLAAKVLCDADLFNLSSDLFEEKGQRLRAEMESLSGDAMKDTEWISFSIDFMKKHYFHTPYGKSVLEIGKKKNIKRLKKSLLPEEQEKKLADLQVEISNAQRRLDKKKDHTQDHESQILLQTTAHTLLLMGQADAKANVLLIFSALALVVTTLMGFTWINQVEHAVPAMLLILVCLIVLYLCLLTIWPSKVGGKLVKDMRKQKTLLFLNPSSAGDYFQFQRIVLERLDDPLQRKESVLRDLAALSKKYESKNHYLRIAYTLFGVGLTSVIITMIVMTKI